MSLIYLYSYMFILLFVGLWPFNFWQMNQAAVDRTSGIILNPPATAYTKAPPEKLSHLKEFTLFLDVTPRAYDRDGYARMLTYSLAGDKSNLMVGQWEDSFVVRLKVDDRRRIVHFESSGALLKDKRTRLAVVYDGKKLTLYKDEKNIKEMETGFLGHSSWNARYPLVIGSEGDGTFTWKGDIAFVSIFDRSFSAEEIGLLPERAKLMSPIVYYSFRESSGRLAPDQGVGIPADLSIPRHFVPYKRTVLEMPRTDLIAYKYYYMDIIVNVIGFLPLGFLVAAYLNRKRLSLRASLTASFFLGTAVTLTIEVLQAYLCTRHSSMTDAIANTMGSVLGALVLVTLFPPGKRTSDLMFESRAETGVVGKGPKGIPAPLLTGILNRHALFLFFTLFTVGMCYEPLRELLRTYSESDSYLHIMLIPLISGYLMYAKGDALLSSFTYSWKTGVSCLATGLALYFLVRAHEGDFSQNDYASLVTTTGFVFWIGAFLLLYGLRTFRTALFPLLFLGFIIPVPSRLMAWFIDILRTGSAFLVSLLFNLTGMPYTREGFVFALPGVAIEIADQCSGIHSSFALLIVGILTSHFVIKAGWKRAVLIASILPIVLIKNAIRIVALSFLGVHVNEGILTHGFLHQSGGFIFYVPALIIMLTLAWMLRRT